MDLILILEFSSVSQKLIQLNNNDMVKFVAMTKGSYYVNMCLYVCMYACMRTPAACSYRWHR